MLGSDLRISLADLAAAGVRLRPVESVTVVRAIARDVAGGTLPGVPSAHVIRLGGDGTITIEGPVAAGGPTVQRAALLLDTLLPAFDAPPELRAPGALRLVVARGLGTLDLPPYASLEEFADALGRFAAADASAVVIDLVKSWASADAQLAAAAPRDREIAQPAAASERAEETRRAAGGLTISDIRRARRATRLTLADISQRTRIPVAHLRELEWGYFRHWPSGLYARTQLVRYARASGLDDQVVVRTVWPMIEAHARTASAAALVPPAPAVDVTDLQLVPVRGGPPAPVETIDVPPRAPRRRWLAALAIPALVALGLLPAYWAGSPEPGQPPAQVEEARTAGETEAAAPAEDGRNTTVDAAGDRAKAPRRAEASSRAGGTVATTGMGAPRPAITVPDGEAYSPSFASEGSAMFYHSDGALMRADTDSGGAVLRVTRIVDDRSRNFHARPSPDGSLIAFDSDREGDRAVYVASARGTNVRRVSGEGFAAIPSWSPDGRTLAFVRGEPDRPRVWNLWTADLETGELTRLTSHRVGQPWGASWFPDGRRIAYSHETRLVVRDLSTGRERAYPSPIKGRLVRTPAVSPDGRRIIFQVYRDGTWLLDLPTGAMRRVLTDPGAEEYTWSPDGRRVAYHSRRSGEWGVWIMAAR